MSEITCGARLRALSWREKHEAGLKMKLLSPGDTQSHAHKPIVHSCHCYRCCSRHRNEWVDLWEPRPAWRWCVSVATSSISGQELRLTESTQITGQGLLYCPSIAIQSWFDPWRAISLLLSICPSVCFLSFDLFLFCVFFVLHPSQNPPPYICLY